MRFVNLRLFTHAVAVVRGRYDDPAAAGEVSHFQALTSALSATVGLGNIAGVAIAVSLGGAGATLWMIVAGLLGMASKFTECTLGQKYRRVGTDGHVMGGAMHYLSAGLAAERGLPRLGKTLAVLFSLLCVGGSFGGGNAFQVKQSLGALRAVAPSLSDHEWVYGLGMTLLTGAVILGGIKSIARTAEKIVPVMCGLYVACCLYIIGANLSALPSALLEIARGAFAPDALYGGLVGVLVVGFQRAAFSNEAGIGSAAIAHAAAKTAYPVREGVVGLLEPFIDTVVICTMTALVIVITHAHQDPALGAVIAARDGAALTSAAMGGVISFAPYVLALAVVLFAYSTMISWSYYGERCWAWLFGAEPALFSLGRYSSHIYRALFLLCVFLGAVMNASSILDFSDLMILGMAFPNILGLLLLSKGVRADLDSYEHKLRAGELPVYTPPPPPAAAPPAAEPPPDAPGNT
ncbi:MAG: alanine:cation symporter family protein [Deltaproteobacteria bacterium]|nr:alanine:cation symporter family protein [Deltaproteobacteria bacterium]